MSDRNVSSTLLLILVVIAVGSVLHLTAGIVLPLVIAVLLSYVLTPIVDYMRRMGLPRTLSVILVVLLLIGFGVLVGLVFYTSVQSLVRRFPVYQARLLELLEEFSEFANLPEGIENELNLTQNISSLIFSLSGGIAEFLGNFMMMLLFVMFILFEKPYLRTKMMQALQGPRTDRISRVFAGINSQVARYLSVKLVISTMTSVSVYLSFSIIGVDFAFIWAILTFLFNFIPSIGSIAISVLSYVFVVLQFAPNWNPVIAAVVSMTVIQFVIGNVLDPKIQGDSLNLSPVIILFSLLFWGWLWGITGAFLAVPLTVTLKIVFENIPGMEWIGILMGTGSYREKKPRLRSSTRNASRTGQ
ncbi:MAG: AI-2E family transporter [Spirochaetaceae bacterium]|nr:MAG: AI-2E family transporter [Spirochaetaceae bacterium]